MNIIKTTTFALFMAVAGLNSIPAVAEETTANPAPTVSETIAHVEKALVEVAKSDFNAAQAHMKAARSSGEKITGNEAVVKKANAAVIQGQIKAKLGDIKAASDELNKALALYKSL